MKILHVCLLYYVIFTISTICAAYKTNNELFENKIILITGGTGYLGRTLTEEIIKYNPKKIIILSRDEVKLAEMQRTFNNKKIHNVLGDIRDKETIQQYTLGVDIVIHAAALKRIDALEDNTQECIFTNILGSLNIFNACKKNNVKQVLFISTDKACAPINIYGGCKFISEKIFTNYNYETTKTIFSVVRFGNILESTGSIIPLLTKKIFNGEDIGLTDERMTRFIISKQDAVDYIFDAIRYSIGGEIFIKKLPAMKIIDLIDILKKKYDAKNKVINIGLRPGEKIHETLINKSEISRAYEYESICVIIPTLPTWLTHIHDTNKTPIYITQGTCLKNIEKPYSSKDAVITVEDINTIFKTLNII